MLLATPGHGFESLEMHELGNVDTLNAMQVNLDRMSVKCLNMKRMQIH